MDGAEYEAIDREAFQRWVTSPEGIEHARRTLWPDAEEDRREGVSGMTNDEMQAVIEAVNEVMGRRMEEVYGEIEALKQAVQDAVQGITATAQVLHDNDTALMAKLMQNEGSVAGEVVERAADAWRDFVVAEGKKLGLRLVVAKS